MPVEVTVQRPDAPGKAAPRIDPGVLRDKQRDFTDPLVVQRFAHDFCESLMGKIDRLDARRQEDDATGAEEAVLSVTTSAVMVGAVRLAQAARATGRSIVTDSPEGARSSVARLRACAADTVRELRESYPDHR